MLVVSELKEVILAEMNGRGFPSVAKVQGQDVDTGLERFAEAIATAIVRYITDKAEVVVNPGTFLVTSATGVPNPVPIILKVR